MTPENFQVLQARTELAVERSMRFYWFIGGCTAGSLLMGALCILAILL